MALKHYKALHTLHGSYGLAQAGDVIELDENEARALIESGAVKAVSEPKEKAVSTITNKTEKKVAGPVKKQSITKPGSH